jgi:serine/threonine protein kinase
MRPRAAVRTPLILKDTPAWRLRPTPCVALKYLGQGFWRDGDEEAMALSTAQMARLNRLLDEALDLDKDARGRWLEALTEENRDLAEALRSALLPDEEASGVSLPKLPESLRSACEPHLESGARIGPYELVRPVGRGGMAQVWHAKRADGAYVREVALKLPAASHLRGDVAKRFTRERDILAGLEHPGIARFYDAGVTPEGLPYFAMEFVRGKTLSAWCDEARLAIPERLSLLLQVLEAVQYAHERGVLHRDIKPSNVLVTESGQVRLVDFGVARLFQRPDSPLTAEYGGALTPEFASPEQLTDGELGPPSDVYSLGVLLYQLLCGKVPHRPQGDPRAETPAAQPPSIELTVEACTARASTPRALSRKLRGDLDAIVLKALEHDPHDRYPSAQALADDVQRYLAERPVEARPGYPGYRLGKFLKRHRTGVAVSAVAALIVASMTVYEFSRWASPSRSPSASTGIPQAAPSTPLAVSDKSIAVLPFADMSEKHDQEYFSDGLSEELIDRLSHSPELRVVSRTSSFYFKGRQATAPEIASTLHVSYLLEGSVRKAGDALRIAVQLVRASDGSDLWSQTYERSLGDIFKTQEEIAQTTAQALKVALAPGGGTRRQQTSIAAYNLLLQGNFFADRYSRADSYRALQFYQRAIATDSNYALAWAKLSDVYFRQALYGWGSILPVSAKAKETAERAIALGPDLALPHLVLGSLYMAVYWDWEQARSQFQRANELDPSDMRVATNLAFLNGGLYRLDEVIEVEKARASRDPLDAAALNRLAVDLFYARRYPEAVAADQQLTLLNPSYAGAHAFQAVALVFLGHPEEALAVAKLETDEPLRLWALSMVYEASRHRTESDRTLRELETKYGDTWPFAIAEVRANRRQVDDALRWLDRAYLRHDTAMQLVKLDPLLQSLRQDPRYNALLVKMKLDGPVPR